MTVAGVEDMTENFLPRRRRWGRERRTWSMVWEGKVVRSRTYYLLGTDISLFRNVSVRDPRHNTDHFMVVGCLRSAPEQEHTRYIMGRRKMPLQPPTEPTREDGIFAAQQRVVLKPHARDRHKNAWISEDTWREGGREFTQVFGDWAAPYRQAIREIENGGWRLQDRK